MTQSVWQANVEPREDSSVRRFILNRCNKPVSYAQVINGWQHDSAFRAFFIGLLADETFPAYFWETPGVALASIAQPFEFVLVNSRQMAAVMPDPTAFTDYFAASPDSDTVVSFMNLGKDARLVVPCPGEPENAYASMATFARYAAPAQQHALWRAVGAAMQQTVRRHTVWLSTCGLGVAWLHLRLDRQPKYYSYAPYR